MSFVHSLESSHGLIAPHSPVISSQVAMAQEVDTHFGVTVHPVTTSQLATMQGSVVVQSIGVFAQRLDIHESEVQASESSHIEDDVQQFADAGSGVFSHVPLKQVSVVHGLASEQSAS